MIVADLAFSIDLKSLSYGGSKIGQVVLPVAAIIFFQQLPFREKLLQKLIDLRFANSDLSAKQKEEELYAYQQTLDRFIGFLCWKIGCDLGFFLINTEFGTWERAFTLAGLIPYTIVQYFFHRIIGQNMLMDGHINPFKKRKKTKPPTKRSNLFQQLLSKYFYEDMGATNYNMTLRRVFVKPLVDYGSMVASWSAYTMGIFYFQSGELTIEPLVHFSHQTMLCFYTVGYFGYIIGYNVGELIYSGLMNLKEEVAVASRESKQLIPSEVEQLGTPLKQLNYRWQEFKYTVIWKVQPILEKYDINLRWMMSVTGGVVFVVLLTPGFTHFFYSLSTNVSHLWFDSLGQMDTVQVAQIISGGGNGQLPDSQIVVAEFPRIWSEINNNNVQIAMDSK